MLMSIFFTSFDHNIDGRSERISVVYPSATVKWEQEIVDIIDDLTRGPYPPRRCVFVSPLCHYNDIVSGVRNRFSDIKDRLGATTHIVVAPYKKNGRLSINDVAQPYQASGRWRLTDEHLTEFAQKYAAAIYEESKSKLVAPHGYQFRKPSGRARTVFLRAENMLHELDSVNVFNHLLLQKWTDEMNTIYIDSFTISSFAMGLQLLISHFEENNISRVPTIQNFRSYQKVSDFNFPMHENYLVIISASTSGGLARNLIENHGAAEKRIVHLVGAAPGSVAPSTVKQWFRTSCLFFDELPEETTPAGPQLQDINIPTEKFVVTPPVRVRITQRHVEEAKTSMLADSFYNDHLHIKQSGRDAGYGRYHLFSTVPDKVEISPGLNKWMSAELVHQVPGSAKTIVYGNDSISKILANELKQIISCKKMISRLNLKKSRINYNDSDSIVVVVYEDSELDELAAICQTLRKWPETFKHYVVCYSFPQTKTKFEAVRQDLIKGEKERKYGWSSYLIMPMGSMDIHDSWLSDYPKFTSEKVSNLSRDLPKKLRKSLLDRISDSDRLPIFFPNINGDRLILRDGSVFFPNSGMEHSHESVYLAVSTTIQVAREGKFEDGLRFDDDPFSNTVIDPRMFSRYNDGILQASLLRALRPSELDFSGDALISGEFTAIILNIIQHAQETIGEAALEFLAALATRKIALRMEDFDRVINTIKEDFILNEIWNLFQK